MGSQIASLFSIMGYEVNIWNRSDVDEKNLKRQGSILKTKLGNLELIESLGDGVEGFVWKVAHTENKKQ